MPRINAFKRKCCHGIYFKSMSQRVLLGLGGDYARVCVVTVTVLHVTMVMDHVRLDVSQGLLAISVQVCDNHHRQP